MFARLCHIVPNGALNRADHASDGPKRDAIEFREGAFLPYFKRVPTNMYTQPVVHDGVSSVHHPDDVHNFSRNVFSSLTDQCELAFQHHPARTAGDRRGSSVGTDRTSRPDRQIGHREYLLKQDERGRTTHSAAGLGTLGDQPGGTELDRRNGLVHRGDHCQDSTFAQLSQVRNMSNEINHHGVDGLGQGNRQRPVQAHPEGARVTRGHPPKIGRGVRPEVEHAEAARSFGRDHKGRVGGAERAQAQHPISIRRHVHCARFLTVQGWGERNSARVPTDRYG
ncbi:hypothetical protein LFM09_35460 [Lentzea alba]|uniref:hypothetical protein n=1 Tax=Lentzea alba TaxID=2714351 RepID=UPI0039BFE0EA